MFSVKLKIVMTMSSADGPDRRTIPIPPSPGGVAIATMVSSLIFLGTRRCGDSDYGVFTYGGIAWHGFVAYEKGAIISIVSSLSGPTETNATGTRQYSSICNISFSAAGGS